MAQFVVRDIEDTVKARLRRRAAANGHSMEEEVRQILRRAANEPLRPAARLGSAIASRFRGRGLQDEIPELRGTPARPAHLPRAPSAR